MFQQANTFCITFGKKDISIMKTNLKLFTLAVFAFASLILATAGMAQTSTTGTVEGVVQDANGAVVPNTTVTLSGGNLIKPVTTTSDSDGVYRSCRCLRAVIRSRQLLPRDSRRSHKRMSRSILAAHRR